VGRQEFDDSKSRKMDGQEHSHPGEAPSENINSAEVLKDQAVHIQAYKKIGDDTYKQVLDCSGEIYTSDGRAGSTGHCVPENNGADLYKITDGKGVSHYAVDASVDRKHDLAVFKELNVSPFEYKDINLAKHDSNASRPKTSKSDGLKFEDKSAAAHHEGDELTTTVYSNGSHEPTLLNATLGDNIELGQFVPAGKVLAGQDITMAVQKIFGEVDNGNSGAMLVDETSNDPIGILDYASKSAGEAVAIPIKLMKDLLDKTVTDVKENLVEPSKNSNDG